MEPTTPQFVLMGQLRREYTILPSERFFLDVLAGSVLYAAVGVAIWEPEPHPALVARIGEDYPQSWLEEFGERGFDTRGINILPHEIDVRSFAAYTSRKSRTDKDPVSHFSRLGVPFPKALLGYRSLSSQLDSKTNLSPTSLRQGDLIPAYTDATAAHICPMDFLTHSLIPAELRQAEFTTVTLDPAAGYMNPTFWSDVPSLVTGLTAFLPSEEELRYLFEGKSKDLWEMADALASYGCELIVIKRGEGGQLVLDAAAHKRWEVTAYPSKVADPTGAGDAFCGGFLAGFRRTYDPLEAALHGNISASLVVEGSGPLYALDALPGLADARLESLRQSIRIL